MKKTGRNDPCVCGSGKKFKKCCERKMIGKRFMASKIEPPKTTSSISSFFQNRITKVISNEKQIEKLAQDSPKALSNNVSKDPIKREKIEKPENISLQSS
jgi:SEC-C motif